MSQSSKRDEQIHKQEVDAARQQKKNSRPERYNDPFRDTIRLQGKGSKNRMATSGWYSDEVSERLRRIYAKKKA
tara:strand:+ start:1706 stop:1927 length:222 start_codon:yes stop_codon:yes gene_type:complete